MRLIREGDNPWLEVTIIEGHTRQVRKMFEEVGHHVEKIGRVQDGPLALDVPPGDWRNLTLLEVAKLKTVASGTKVASPPSPHVPLRAVKAPAIKAARTPRSANPLKPPRSQRPSHSGKPSFAPRSPRPSRSLRSGTSRSGTSRPGTSKPSRVPKHRRD